jgi:molybdenum cofactor cytidylyltransferase
VSVHGIILAAGASTRMGSPKALLKFGGRTALELLTATFRACGLEVVAVIPPDDALDAEARRLGVTPVRNPIAHLGRTGSLQFGLRELPQDRDVLMTPVDCPLVAVKSCQAVLAAVKFHAILRPTFEGRGGHPVFLSHTLRTEILALAAATSLRELIHRDPARRLDLPVDDPEILTNVNTPEDYAAALARFDAGSSS